MNQYKKHIVQVTIVALMLNSAMPAQAIDWSYWTNCAREKISGFIASVPTTNQVIDRLKQPKVVFVASTLVPIAAAVVAVYYMKQQGESHKKKVNESLRHIEDIYHTRFNRKIRVIDSLLGGPNYSLHNRDSFLRIPGSVFDISNEEFENVKEEQGNDQKKMLEYLGENYQEILIQDIASLENYTSIIIFSHKKLLSRNFPYDLLRQYISDLRYYKNITDGYMKEGALAILRKRPLSTRQTYEAYLESYSNRLSEKIDQMDVLEDIVVEARQG